MRYKSCFLGDLAEAAGVDVRTFCSWITAEDQIRMIRIGHNFYDRKLKPKVVEFLINKYVPELKARDELIDSK